MNIVMMTNTYLPHTGGVARSVAWFGEALRERGHRVLIVAPAFKNMPQQESGVVRIPAIQHFNGSDFSVRLPTPGLLSAQMDEFQPQVIHSHHPFLVGDTALRVAARRNLPIVFTHHTMYEQYTHYVPGDSPAMQRFAVRLATEYANLCDHVIAPSESIASVLRQRHVTTPITSIPTGIRQHDFCRGDGHAAREKFGIPRSAFLVGHVGRLAPEKNLAFLARASARFLLKNPRAHFLLVGSGPSIDDIRHIFATEGVNRRLHCSNGSLNGNLLANAYHAMDVFAFASKSETQGMVLAEAMTTGVPVVALDAPGAREVVEDGVNGRLLRTDDEDAFAAALAELAAADEQQRQQFHRAARRTAEQFSMTCCATRLLQVYEHLIARGGTREPTDDAPWAGVLRVIGEEWDILAGVGRALGEALSGEDRYRDK